jgi:hypothetical protein
VKSGGDLTPVGGIDMEDAESAVLDGGYLYLSAGFRGFLVFDIRNPRKPRMVSSCRDVYSMRAAVSSSRAFIVDGDNLLRVSVEIPPWLR